MMVLRALALTSAALVGVSSLPAPTAHAGTPYTCVCEGKKKRSIGSTYFCGHRKPACTTKEYNAFRKDACAAKGCTVAR